MGKILEKRRQPTTVDEVGERRPKIAGEGNDGRNLGLFETVKRDERV